MSAPMQIVGICRFSYLASRGWKQTVRDDIRATAEKLYTPERMEERFSLFEHVCLPSMTAQTDRDFTFMVLASYRMPEAYRARLEALVAPHDTVVIRYLRPRPMNEAVTVALRRTVDADGPPTVQFCLDDDDALSVHYVARLRTLGTNLIRGGFVDETPFAVSNPRGITLSKKDGVFSASENYAPFLALGLALVTPSGLGTNVYMVPHFKTPTRHQSLVDPYPLTYLRGLHDHHDSRAVSIGRRHGLPPERLERYLEEEFPFLTPQTLSTVFGATSILGAA